MKGCQNLLDQPVHLVDQSERVPLDLHDDLDCLQAQSWTEVGLEPLDRLVPHQLDYTWGAHAHHLYLVNEVEMNVPSDRPSRPLRDPACDHSRNP
jgi:hypothetical protein